MSVRILAFSGSLRQGSFNTKLVRAAAAGARRAGAEVTEIELRDYPLPVFDEDLEAKKGLDPNARRLKDLFLAHHGLLISSPEYNSSISAALKNAIDWISRPCTNPDGTPEPALGCFVGKVAGLLAASPGAIGGLRGLVELRRILGNIQVLVHPDQFALGRAHEQFNETGTLKDPKTQASAERIGENVAQLLMKLRPARAG